MKFDVFLSLLLLSLVCLRVIILYHVGQVALYQEHLYRLYVLLIDDALYAPLLIADDPLIQYLFTLFEVGDLALDLVDRLRLDLLVVFEGFETRGLQFIRYHFRRVCDYVLIKLMILIGKSQIHIADLFNPLKVKLAFLKISFACGCSQK